MSKETLDTPRAVRVVNETMAQWADAVRDVGFDLNDATVRDLLMADWERMWEAMRVVTDWCPS
jgi:hypothetical protein